MKIRRLVRNVALGTVAWKFIQSRYQRRANARSRARASWAGGFLFAAGAGAAWMYREKIAELVRGLRDEAQGQSQGGAHSVGNAREGYAPIAGAYDPPPPSHKKQAAAERREAAEKRAREQATHKPVPAVRVEKNAAPDLTVPLADALKH